MLITVIFAIAYACLVISAGCGIGKALKQHIESAYPFTEPPALPSYDLPTPTSGANTDGFLKNSSDAHP